MDVIEEGPPQPEPMQQEPPLPEPAATVPTSAAAASIPPPAPPASKKQGSAPKRSRRPPSKLKNTVVTSDDAPEEVMHGGGTKPLQGRASGSEPSTSQGLAAWGGQQGGKGGRGSGPLGQGVDWDSVRSVAPEAPGYRAFRGEGNEVGWGGGAFWAGTHWPDCHAPWGLGPRWHTLAGLPLRPRFWLHALKRAARLPPLLPYQTSPEHAFVCMHSSALPRFPFKFELAYIPQRRV